MAILVRRSISGAVTDAGSARRGIQHGYVTLDLEDGVAAAQAGAWLIRRRSHQPGKARLVFVRVNKPFCRPTSGRSVAGIARHHAPAGGVGRGVT